MSAIDQFVMSRSIARSLLLLAAFTVAVPQADAKRMGSGRSLGAQGQVLRQAPAPKPQPAPAVRPQPAPVQPGIARQAEPPTAPAQQIRRQAASPWGGMLGGALIGLGLGSILSPDRQATAPDQNAGNQSSGADAGSGASASGTDAASTREPEISLASIILWGVLALLVVWLIRRARARAAGRHRD